MRTLALIGMLALAGCAPTMIALYNPETKQAVECKPDPWATWTPASDAERCAAGFEKYGFVRVN